MPADPAAGPPTLTTTALPPGQRPAETDPGGREFLRRRLLAAGCICAAASVGLALMGATFAERGDLELAEGAVAPNAVLAAASLAGLAIAWAGRGAGWLRAAEAVIFGAVCVGAAVQRYRVFAALPPPLADPDHRQLTVWYANAVSNLYAFFVVLLYGLLVPNTLRRSVAAVGGMAALPVLASLAAAAANPGVRPYTPVIVTNTVLGMTVAGAGAVFGASRFYALRREAIEARREALQVGPYALQSRLGEGGMGEVFLAEHRLLKRPCAIKFIRPELASNPVAAARFEREVRAVTGLTHPNTVRVYDYGRSELGSFYYVMEYLDGPTLGGLVRQSGPLLPGRAVYLLRQVCGALAEAHAGGLIHRDLKPGNILVARLGGQWDVAKLLDFGLVYELSAGEDLRLTQTGALLGTPAYMCPEQAAGQPADARGDVYSLGAVAYFALAGRPPFDGRTVGAVLVAHLTQPPPPLPDAPADLARVVARCLEKDPAARFQTVAELDDALAGCVCAADWSARQAAAWWQAAPGRPDTPPGCDEVTRIPTVT